LGKYCGDLVEAFQYTKGVYEKDGERLFTRVYAERTRGHSFKLKEGRFRLDTGRNFLRRGW